MPSARRQRKPRPVLYVSSPTQRTKLTHPVVFSTPPVSPVASLVASPVASPIASPPASLPVPLAIALKHGVIDEPRTPIKGKMAAAQDEVNANQLNNSNVLTGYGTLNGETIVAEITALNPNTGIGGTPSSEDKIVKQGPTDSPDNPLKVLVPSSSEATKTNTLSEAIQKTHKEGAAALLNPWFKSPMGWTGLPILDHVMNNVRLSRYGLWLGNHSLIDRSCIWRSSDRPSICTLQWRENVSNKSTLTVGDAIICIVGTVSSEGLNSGPDAGWQLGWGEDRLHKQKRSFRVVDPGAVSKIPQVWWESQMKGAFQVVETGCTATKNGAHEVTHCFVNRDDNYLRFRSPLFMPVQGLQDNDEDDAKSISSSESKEGLPDGCEFDSWNFSSQGVCGAFGQVIERGFQPVALPAYTRHNKPIHPNDVNPMLSGAIVLVYFTLERMRFSKDKGKRTEYQFYANLLKTQVLKNAPPTKSIATKRKFVHSYGPNDDFGPGGSFSGGAPPAKKLKLILSTD